MWFQVGGGWSGVRTRRTIRRLRATGRLEGEFTSADAVELADTGTIRKKTVEDKIRGCVVPIEILFRDRKHHLVYQLEMHPPSEKEVAGWIEAARALRLTDLARILEEVAAMRDVICHLDQDPDYPSGGEKIGDRLSRRALDLHDEIERTDGLAELRRASERYLRKNARDLLPLPTL